PESCIFLDAHNSEKPHELSFSMSVFSVEKSKYGCSTSLEDTDPIRGGMTGGPNCRGSLGENKSIGMNSENETRPRNVAFNYIVRII
ncbi:hypothetical protein J8V12_07780, partial [Photorhabdus thracensis]|nr:hypothetical protein [Photorhabdus thracensis]